VKNIRKVKVLLIYPNPSWRRRFEEALDLSPVTSRVDEDIRVVIHEWKFDDSTTVFDTSNSSVEQVRALCEQEIYERILLVLPNTDVENLQHDKVIRIEAENEFYDAVAETMAVTPQQKSQIHRIFHPHVNHRMATTFFFGSILMQRLFHILGDDDDVEIEMAVDASMESYDREQANTKKRRTPLSTQDDTWEKRLKLSADNQKKEEKEEEAEFENPCVVCYDAERSVVIDPCCHTVMCAKCSVEVLERDDVNKKCPVCQKPITKILVPIK